MLFCILGIPIKLIGIGTISTDNLNQSQTISKTLADNIRKVMTITNLLLYFFIYGLLKNFMKITK